MKNPLKTLILKFIRYFYDPQLKYADDAIEKWVKSLTILFGDILVNGLALWLVLISISSIFQIQGINLGPGAWHLLNIIQLGLILWFIEKIYVFIRRGYKDE